MWNACRRAATISAEGLILYANKRFAEMVNQPLEHVISGQIANHLDQEAWKKIHAVFKNRHEFIKCETILRPADKPYMPVNLTASHLPSEGQNVLCLVVTDLSAQKQNEELRLAKELAEKASAAKDAFLAALSHELRTPLNPVLLLASDGAVDKELPPNARAMFASILNNVELEARLIDDLLDLNRIVHGKLILDLCIVDSHAVLRNAIAAVEPEFKKKKISLVVEFEQSPCKLKADSIRLQQVIWNVLKNAIKFTPEKGRIKITTRSRDEQLTITISDTGIGMTSEELQRIFDALFTWGDHAKNYGAHQFGGLGLGLSISKTLIKMHKGTINAHSEGPGKGATFVIQLPLVTD